WVPDDARDALLDLAAERLPRGGLFYLNYNSKPGWNVRGLVREFLLAQTAGEKNLSARARLAQEVASTVESSLTGIDHNYSRLLAGEFRFVHQGDVAWVGHEFLSPDNHPYWRSEFLALSGLHGLEYIADADFNCKSGRVPQKLPKQLQAAQITGRSIEDT